MSEKATFGTTILAPGAALEGELRVRGELVIDGVVAGSIFSEGAVAVGPEARILGEVCAAELRVKGRVDGIVRARKLLRVFSSGKVHGHASYDALEVERGGLLLGSASQGFVTAGRNEAED